MKVKGKSSSRAVGIAGNTVSFANRQVNIFEWVIFEVAVANQPVTKSSYYPAVCQVV